MDEKRTAIYLRYSAKDETDNIGAQREICRNWLSNNGFDADDVDEYAEDRQSAYLKPMRERPRWRDLEEQVRRGKVGRIVTRHTDRMSRRVRDTEDLIDLVGETGVQVVAIWSGGVMDLSTPSGIQSAQMQASMAEAESRIKSQRVRAAKARARAEGKSTGGPRPFGYESINGDLRADEAELIRNASQAVLDGVSLHGVTKMFEASGMPTTRGGYKWHKSAVKTVLIRWRNAGRLSHVTDAERAIAKIQSREPQAADAGPAAYPAIVSVETLTAVRAVLLDEGRKRASGTGLQGGPRVQTLLSGIAVCGKCGSTLAGRSAGTKPGERIAVYCCTGERCYMTMPRDVLDDLAARAMARFWTRAKVEDYAPDTTTRDAITRLQAEQGNLAARRKSVARMLGAGLMSDADAEEALQEVATSVRTLTADLEDLQRRYALASALAVPVVVGRTVSLKGVAALVDHFKGQHLDIRRKQVQQTWRIVVRERHYGKARTVEHNGEAFREVVSQRRKTERRVRFDCILSPHLSFDPVEEDLAGLLDAAQD